MIFGLHQSRADFRSQALNQNVPPLPFPLLRFAEERVTAPPRVGIPAAPALPDRLPPCHASGGEGREEVVLCGRAPRAKSPRREVRW